MFNILETDLIFDAIENIYYKAAPEARAQARDILCIGDDDSVLDRSNPMLDKDNNRIKHVNAILKLNKPQTGE